MQYTLTGSSPEQVSILLFALPLERIALTACIAAFLVTVVDPVEIGLEIGVNLLSRLLSAQGMLESIYGDSSTSGKVVFWEAVASDKVVDDSGALNVSLDRHSAVVSVDKLLWSCPRLDWL